MTDARESLAAAADLLDGYVYEARFVRDDDSPDNRIIWASEGFGTVFGISVEDYNGATVWGRGYHHDEQQGAISRARALRRGEIVEAEIRVMHASGDTRWLYLKNRPVFDSDGHRVVGFLGIGQDITTRKQVEEGLRVLEREITDVSNREQQRIASDLHDGLGQDLTGISLLLRSISDRHARGSTDLAVPLEEVITLVNRAIHGARTLARGLAPLEIGHEGLVGALRSLASHACALSGVDVRFHHSGRYTATARSSAADNQLYRIAREAVYNALRHSGARSICILLRARSDGLWLRVRDDGRGLPQTHAPTAGMGLRIMGYRARTIGASLFVRNGRLTGTRIVCLLPARAVTS